MTKKCKNKESAIIQSISSFAIICRFWNYLPYQNIKRGILNTLWTRLHGHAIFGVVSVSKTRMGTTRQIPVSCESLSLSLSLFFFPRFSDTPAMKKKKKNTDFDRIPLILWYTLKQKSKFRVCEVIRLKVETHISSSQPTVPPSLWPLLAAIALCPLPEQDWVDRRAP